jgi:hypothetical protein
MPQTNVLRKTGPTTALSVANTSHSAVAIAGVSDQTNYAAFLNTGTTTVAVQLAQSNPPAAVLPADGASADVIVLPPSMTMPMVVAVPANGFSVTAIGSAAGPSLVYITPVESL